jgi:hypothetical protein
MPDILALRGALRFAQVNSHKSTKTSLIPDRSYVLLFLPAVFRHCFNREIVQFRPESVDFRDSGALSGLASNLLRWRVRGEGVADVP